MSTSYSLGELEKAEDLQLSGWGRNQHCAVQSRTRSGLQQSSTQAKSHSPQLENRSERSGMDLFGKWENSHKNDNQQR